MYQYSLDFFKGLFVGAIMASEKSDDLEERLGFLNKEFLESLYRNICRSLFEKDKLIFSMLLTIKLMEMSGEIVNEELRFFLTGGVSLGEEMPEIPASWISEKMWGEAFRLDKLKNIKGFLDIFKNELAFFKEMYDSPAPHKMKLPGKLANLNIFQYLLVIRAIRPDMLVPAISDFVTGKIGDYFIVPPAFDLGLIFKDSGPTTPLIFVLSPGADPMNNLEKYAESKKKKMDKISLGKGQGPKAEKFIAGIKNGTWVVL
jgi:dynein heavy chain